MEAKRHARSRRRGAGFGWLALAVLALGGAAPTEQTLVSIGTGGKTGIYYLAGGAICDLVNARRWTTGVRCLAEPSEGSVENLRDVRSGVLTFGLAQSDTQHDAVVGAGAFAAAGPDRDLRSVLGLFPEPFTVVARPEAEIATLSDLSGKRVSFGPPGSGGRATMAVVMQAMGWTDADFGFVADTTMADTPRALCAGEIDAAVLLAASPNRTVEQMVSGCGALLVPVAGPAIERMIETSSFYDAYEIPAGTYADQPVAVPTFALTATLVTSSRTSPPVVQAVAAAIFAGLDTLRAAHPAFAGLERARMLGAGLSAPLHEGVLRTLGEKP